MVMRAEYPCSDFPEVGFLQICHRKWGRGTYRSAEEAKVSTKFSKTLLEGREKAQNGFMADLILLKSPGSAESSMLCSLLHSVANSFQKPHCLSRTLGDLLFEAGTAICNCKNSHFESSWWTPRTTTGTKPPVVSNKTGPSANWVWGFVLATAGRKKNWLRENKVSRVSLLRDQ